MVRAVNDHFYDDLSVHEMERARLCPLFFMVPSKRIISLLPEAEKNIEIRVNGALTGYGELVEVDDKLGVEIHSWLSGNNNVK